MSLKPLKFPNAQILHFIRVTTYVNCQQRHTEVGSQQGALPSRGMGHPQSTWFKFPLKCQHNQLYVRILQDCSWISKTRKLNYKNGEPSIVLLTINVHDLWLWEWIAIQRVPDHLISIFVFLIHVWNGISKLICYSMSWEWPLILS